MEDNNNGSEFPIEKLQLTGQATKLSLDNKIHRLYYQEQKQEKRTQENYV